MPIKKKKKPKARTCTEEQREDTKCSRHRWILKIPEKKQMGSREQAGLTQRNITFLTVRGERTGRLRQTLASSQSWEVASIVETETSKRGKEVEVREEGRRFQAIFAECGETGCLEKCSEMYGWHWAGHQCYQCACLEQNGFMIAARE